jgi:hypothetical protein
MRWPVRGVPRIVGQTSEVSLLHQNKKRSAYEQISKQWVLVEQRPY